MRTPKSCYEDAPHKRSCTPRRELPLNPHHKGVMPLQKPSATFRLCKRLFEFSPSIVASSIVADIVRDLISVSQGISMPSHIDSSGYSQEEAIFKKKELEQLAQIRAELDVKRKANETAAAAGAADGFASAAHTAGPVKKESARHADVRSFFMEVG